MKTRPDSSALPMVSLAALVVSATAAACGGDDPDAGREAAGEPATVVQPANADSLVLTAPDGAEVWFTDSREATAEDGQGCIERVMEIRRNGDTIAVPLLYTGAAPVLINDSTMQARIWLNCRPGNVYQVNLTTGFPTHIK